MTSVNVEFVRSIFAAWERGDFSDATWAHPDIEFASPMGVEVAESRGLREMSKSWGETLMAWTDVRTRAEAFRELGAGRVLVLYSFSGRGRLSGVDVDDSWTEGAAVFHIRESKVARLVIYVDRDRALADMGLSAERDAADVADGPAGRA